MTSGGSEVTTVPTSADDVVFDSNSGNVTLDATANCKSLTQVAGYAGLLTHNTTRAIISVGDITLLNGCYSAQGVTSYIYINGDCTLTSGGNLMPQISAFQTVTFGDNISFLADQRCFIIITANGSLNLNGKTISGNSATNRLLIYSNTIGTPRTITVNGGSFANCDFRDIAFNNGGADLDLSGITGGSGDCGGNSMSGGGVLTLTTPTTQTFASTGGNWSDAAKWTSRVPLPQDLARFQPMSAGQTITVDMPRLPDTDFSGCGSTNLPSVNLTTTGLTYEIYGSLNLTGVGTWICNKAFTFGSRSNATLTSNGKTLNGAVEVQIAMPSVTLTCNDAFITAASFKLLNGTLYSTYSVTSFSLETSAGTTTNINDATLTLTGSVFTMGGTWVYGLSTISLAYTGAVARTFAGGTNTYNDITIAPGSGVLTFSGAFTFRNMTMSSAGTRSIVFTKGTTYTMTGDSFLNGAGVDDAPIISPSLLNGGFETAGAGGADVFANWADSVAGASTITRDTSDKYAGDASCRFDVDGSNSNTYIAVGGVMTLGEIYRVSVIAKATDASTSFAIVGFDGADKVAALTDEWAEYIFYGVSTNTGLAIKRSTAAGKSIWIDDVTLTPLNSVLIQSNTEGEPFTLSKSSGLIASNYLSLKDSIATGGATWLAGYNSTNISGNTGWHFNSPASGTGVIEFVGNATAKALCRGIPAAAEIVFTASATAKALCRAAGSGVIEFVGACSAIVAAWKTTGLFKATERYIGQYFKASKRRK